MQFETVKILSDESSRELEMVRQQARREAFRSVERTPVVRDGGGRYEHELDGQLWGEAPHPVFFRLLAGDTEREELKLAVDRQDGREAAEAAYCRRAEIDAWVEKKRRESLDQRGVSGDYWGAGPEAEKRWLDAQVAQLRIEARELVQDGRRKGVRVNPLTDPQVAAIKRQAESLRHRHNFKRYVEALGISRDGDEFDFEAALVKAQAWRRRERLTYAQATERLARLHTRLWVRGEVDHWVGVEGLIAA